MKYDIKKGMAKAQKLLAEADELRANNGSDEDIRGKTEAFDAEVALIETAKADEARHAAIATADEEESEDGAKSLRDHDVSGSVRMGDNRAKDEYDLERGFWQGIENTMIPEGPGSQGQRPE